MPFAPLEITPPTATLTLMRPDARNALSVELLGAMLLRTAELESREDVTVLVVTGAGKSFCAGMDLKAVLDNPGMPERLLRLLAELTVRLRNLPMVTVARVNGAAIGGGCGLACVCDFTVTHADSKMGFPEVDLGVCPAVVAPWVVRRIGAGRARAVLLSGGLMSGREAFERGLATHCAPDLAGLDGATAELVDRLAQGGPNALRATKRLLNELDGSADEGVVMRGAEISAQVLATPEAQRRLRARTSQT